MKAKESPAENNLYQRWKEEHHQLNQSIAELSEWLAIQTKLRTAQFLESIHKLSELNGQLQKHFAREEALSDHICESSCHPSPEAEAVRRQSDRDHNDISTRLQQLIDRMQVASTEQDAWKSSIHEIGLILDLIEQHEEQESESVCCLLPRT